MPIFDVRMRNSVRIQPIVNEELVLTPDATARRWCVSGTRHLEGFLFQLHRSTDVFCDFGNSL
jgi:hypothetical protein